MPSDIWIVVDGPAWMALYDIGKVGSTREGYPILNLAIDPDHYHRNGVEFSSLVGNKAKTAVYLPREGNRLVFSYERTEAVLPVIEEWE